jgi:cysteine desulfurase
MASRSVYLDHAATTPIDPAVRDAMSEAAAAFWGNPSSLHAPGVAAAAALDRARDRLRHAGGSRFRRVVLTSGGTEANNLACLGLGRGGRRRRVVAGTAEHASVLGALDHLESLGADVVRVPVGPAGDVDVQRTAEAARDASLVVVHLVHNELGTVTDVPALAAALATTAPDALLHVDAVQALGRLDLPPLLAGAHAVALSAHKVHGPKGVGALLLAGDLRPRPLLFGGDQQERIRPGTENVAGAIAFAEAATRAVAARAETAARLGTLDRALCDGIAARGIPLRPLVPAARRVPGLVALAFAGLPAQVVLHRLEARGVYCSAGSACHAGRPRSHVLDAIGAPPDLQMIRISMGRDTVEADVEAFLDAARDALREVSR